MTMFFIADSCMLTLMQGGLENYFDNFLIAMNYLDNSAIEYIEKIAPLGKNILIDSGIFALASDHSRKNNIPIRDAFTSDPEKIDGFAELYDKYVKIIKTYEKKLWGYIELDMGGQENKKRIRNQLENLGLTPIPVYHPLADDDSYFDYLCNKYTRIAVGNIVDAESDFKKKIIWNIDKRRKKYKNIWIHYLGMSLNPCCLTFRVDSCDSSEPSLPVRFARLVNKTLLKSSNILEKCDFCEISGSNKLDNRIKTYQISGMQSKSDMMNCDNYQKELDAYQ